MSLSDRLHLAHDNSIDDHSTHDHSTDEGESATPPVGEEAIVDHPFSHSDGDTALDTPLTDHDSSVDEPVATTDDDRLADEPLATTSLTDDEPTAAAGREDDALVAAPPTDEHAAVTTHAPVTAADEPLVDEPVPATPAGERSSVVTPTDEYTAGATAADGFRDDGLATPGATGVDSDERLDSPAGTETSVSAASPAGLGGDDRVKEPLADDFVTDSPQNPVFVPGTAGADGVEPPAADATTPPVGDATTPPGAEGPGAEGPGAEGTEAPAAGAKEQPGDWREVLMEFVDHPRQAVEKADRLVEDAVRSLTEQINREHSGLRDAWRTHGEPSTEDLRKALRGYRDFFEKVLNNR